MNDEEMKRLWQNQTVTEPAPDVTALVAEAREKHRKFQRVILWRDFREAGVALALIPLFLYYAQRPRALWTSYLIVLALIFVAGFMVIDRLRRRRAASPSSESVAEALGSALREVDHQIWLLRNVLWWYIAPLMGSLMVDAVYELLRGRISGLNGVLCLAIFGAVGLWVWRLNQSAVQRDLEPRRRDLQHLLDQLR